MRLLQLLLYEMCRPGQPNPLIRALSHSLYESIALSLWVLNNLLLKRFYLFFCNNFTNSRSQMNSSPSPSLKSIEAETKESVQPSVSHSTSMPCLHKNVTYNSQNKSLKESYRGNNKLSNESTECQSQLNPLLQRSMSLSTLRHVVIIYLLIFRDFVF